MTWTISWAGAVVALASIVLAAGPARAAVDPGDPGDGVADLLLDPAFGSLAIDPDGLTINGYVIRSDAGIFTGAPANNLGWFTEDTDTSISGNMGFELTGMHDLGDVIGPEWEIIDPVAAAGRSSGGIPVNPYDDLTFTCTYAGQPGTYYGNLIVVPEPVTLGLLGLGGLALLRRR